jgi:hypothetical protein
MSARGEILTTACFEIVEVLQIQPKLCVVVEIPRQSQGSLRGDPPTLMHNLADACRRYVQFECAFYSAAVHGARSSRELRTPKSNVEEPAQLDRKSAVRRSVL